MSAPGTVGAARRGLIDATPLRAAGQDPFPRYHEIAAEARMTAGVVDSLGFDALGYIGPPPPEARLSYYVEYGPDPREPERRLFIACSASLPKLPKPSLRTRAKPPPDGLRTPAEAASKLGCSIKTLNGHIVSGALGYVIIGHGKKRPRKMFTDGDLNAFIINQTRKDVPCPSTASRARRSSTSSSGSEVIAFTAAPKPRPGAKPKK